MISEWEISYSKVIKTYSRGGAEARVSERELAERREKALKDEAMFLEEAKRIGREEGKKEGIKEGKKEGIEEKRNETILNLLKMKVLTVEQIAEATGAKIMEIEKLKRENPFE